MTQRKVGVSVRCTLCGRTKKPVGRSAPLGTHWCDDDCEGYRCDPKPGCLWPGESEDEFGYACGTNATEVRKSPSTEGE